MIEVPFSTRPPNGTVNDSAPPTCPKTMGCIVKYEDCFTPSYYYWSARLGIPPYPSRKQWEDVYIAQALWERGCIAPGKHGIGFGVGKERMVALFAGFGCKILATDQSLSVEAKKAWQDTGQLSTNKDELFFPGLCDKTKFDANVEFENCDMNAIPERYFGQFDFAYSACSLDHLGTITHGMKFIENSLKCVKPGGWVVHSTENNVGSNERTIQKGDTVFWRNRDIEALIDGLRNAGYYIENTDFSRGAHPENYAIDYHPYKRATTHTVLEVGGHTISSILLIAQRPESMATLPARDIEWPFIGAETPHVHTPFLTRLKRSIRKRLSDS